MKKIISGILAVALMLSLSVTAFAQSSVSATYDEGLLLDAVEPIIEAYEKHYTVENVSVLNVVEVPADNGERYVEFLLNFDATLNYQNALEIPRVRGIAKALKIEEKQSVSEFVSALNTTDVKNIVGTAAKQEANHMNIASKTNILLSQAESFSMTNKEIAAYTTDYVIDKIASYVAELEDEYIGEKSECNIGLRASLDDQGNVLKLEYGVFDGYTDDIFAVIPATEEDMIQSGVNQIDELIAVALNDVSEKKGKSQVVSPNSNTSFVYYRVNARDYANRYTSNAAEVTCTNSDCENVGGRIRRAVGFYNNNEYTNHCCNDCANYVSQAMKAGGVPADSMWTPSDRAWYNCVSMITHFTLRKGYWTETTYANCNAGGIIMLRNSNGTATHAMMNVHNDGLVTKYSAHTNDRKAFVYDHSDLISGSITSVSYYVFDNVYPAH